MVHAGRNNAPPQPPLGRVTTFENRGLLTSNDGLVLTFEDGSEFQITIVQSR